MGSEEVARQIEARLKAERAKLEGQVADQIAKEKQAMLDEIHAAEAEERRKKEELENALAENQRKLDEAAKKSKEDEEARNQARYRELEEEQRRRDAAREARRAEEAKTREEQKKILGKGNARPKLSFSFG
mmetsp:Transcript_18086/g.58516  ORF Transcript_18086/g.58516 Transcript_18086/m.58516 type:complete len:131 (+) Transcript_18086:853-1245(+)